MKPLKKHHYLIYQFHLPMLVIGLALIFFWPKQIVFSFRAHWLILLYTIVICFLPRSSQRLGATKKFNTKQWLGTIFITQIGMALTFYGIYTLTTQAMPNITLPAISFETLSVNTLVLWGLFPFGFFALFAASIAKTGYIDKQRGLLSVSFSKRFKNTIEDDIGVSVDSFMRVTIIAALSFTSALLALMIFALIKQHLQWPLITGAKLETLILCTLLMMVVTSQAWQKSVRRMASWAAPSLIVILVVIFLLMIITFFGSVILEYIRQNAPAIATGFNFFETPKAIYYWFIFMAFWVLAWLPIYAGMLAYISQGYKIRSMILANLILPLFAAIFVICTMKFNWQITSINETIGLWIGIIGIAILFGLYFRDKWLTHYLRATLPDTEDLKQRPRHRLLQNLVQTFSMFTILYLLSGSILIAGLMFLVLLPTMLTAIINIL